MHVRPRSMHAGIKVALKAGSLSMWIVVLLNEYNERSMCLYK